MTIDRPTLASLYGTMCCKCLESLLERAAACDLPRSLNDSRSELVSAVRLRPGRSLEQRARMLALAAIVRARVEDDD